jgi:hypothetical protein
MHKEYFSILNSSVTNQQVIDAGYSNGITRRSLDDTEVLVQFDQLLPLELDEFVTLKDQTVDQIESIMSTPQWHNNDVVGF